jgi:U3 small nucleolar RNA-associated protein 11
MSSLRNAVKRITHKERAQPRHRQHLGILEKKKDYRVRARDYHRKEDAIALLREKASMRNPDEFYFGMHNAEVNDRVHRKTQQARQKEFEANVGHDTIRLMKDQDLAYIRMQKQMDLKKIDRLQSSLHLLENETLLNLDGSSVRPSKRKHTIFVDTREEVETFDAAKHFDTLPEMVGRSFNRPRISDLKQAAVGTLFNRSDDSHNDEVGLKRGPTTEELIKKQKLAKKQARTIAKARAVSYGELRARQLRVAKIARAEAHLTAEKLVSHSTGTKRKVAAAANGLPAQYKWRQKRLK